MRTRTPLIALLLAASSSILLGCSDSTSSNAKTEGPEIEPTTLGELATASWSADTVLVIPAGALGTLRPTLNILNTVKADSTFSAQINLLQVYQGNDVQGPIYTRKGTWHVSGDAFLVMTPQTCMQADTATVLGVPGVPFNMAGNGFTANTLKQVACGAPDTVRTRPLADGHWNVPMKVNMPGLGSGTWLLDFVRQP